MKRLAAPLEVLLSPLSPLYAGVMRARNFAYDHDLLRSFEVNRPVVSIGNLTAGGTGKTPLTALIIETLSARGIRVGVISRGYRGTTPGREKVRADGSAESARRFGDEPTWLAARFPRTPVYVGTNKVAVCETLLANETVDLILADDAFQHRRLKRSMDIVVVDATEPEWHYRSLPLGRMREGFASLARAHAIFLTKVNLAHPEHLRWLRERINGALGAALHAKRNVPVFEMESVITAFDSLNRARGEKSGHKSVILTGTGEAGVESKTRWVSKRVLLVSGIGRPATFEASVRQASDSVITGHLVFGDHHDYGVEDFARIEAEARRLQVEAVVVTEKDAVKMASWNPSVDVWVSRLETRPRTDLGVFYEAVDRLLL